MKRSSLNSPLALLLGCFFVMFVISCGKDGAAGPAGADGAEGPAGPKGAAGDSGTATAIYSTWLEVAFAPDTIHLAGGGIDTVGYFAYIRVPKLTAEMLNTADVKVYFNTGSTQDPVIYQLPYYDFGGYRITVAAYTDTIYMYSNSDVSTYSLGGSKYLQYRYMIMPGNTAARKAIDIDWSDYNAVKAYLRLND